MGEGPQSQDPPSAMNQASFLLCFFASLLPFFRSFSPKSKPGKPSFESLPDFSRVLFPAYR
jgi:hypothetical protein